MLRGLLRGLRGLLRLLRGLTRGLLRWLLRGMLRGLLRRRMLNVPNKKCNSLLDFAHRRLANERQRRQAKTNRLKEICQELRCHIQEALA
jgi:hypothetical protein